MRTREVVSERDWDIMTSALDGDTQLILSESLECCDPGPCVAYYADDKGNIDSESSPHYTSEMAD